MSSRGWENVTLAEIGMRAFPKQGKKAAHVPQERRSKYRAVRTVIHGWTFHSKAEGARYLGLLALGASGYIRNLELQPFWHLWVGGSAIDRGVFVGKYIADFRYEQRVLDRHGERW